VKPVTWVALLLLLAGCTPQGDGSLLSIPPPPGWEESLVQYRQSKDRTYRQNADSPLRAEDRATFGGLEYFAYDPRLYLVGPIHTYPEPTQFEIVATSGEMRPCEKFGWIRFEVDGAPQELQVYRLLDIDSIFLPFMDATTGQETYPAGRYIDVVGPSGGPYVIDFNQAYNPSCAYGEPSRFACPVTPPENRLDVRIEAGERGFILPD